MGRPRSLTEGNIFGSLIRFAVPALFTLFLQALYGGVDLLVGGQFAQTADVSGVATGSMLLQTVTMVVTGLSMGITILVGERIGRREPEDAGRAIGGGICLFACFAVLLTAVLVGGAEVLARLMHAPEHAFHQTVLYIRICGAGSLFIVAYNVLGSIFRGIGDSRTPLLTVAIACVAIEDKYGNTPTQRAELEWLLYNRPLEYAQLVLGGEMEHYLSLGCDHGRLED